MSELGPEAQRILRRGRTGDDPSPADRVRIRAALAASIAAGAVGTTALTAEAAMKSTEAIATTTAASVAKPVAASFLGGALAKGIFIAVVSTVGVGAIVVWPRPAPPEARAVAQNIALPTTLAPAIIPARLEVPKEANDLPAEVDSPVVVATTTVVVPKPNSAMSTVSVPAPTVRAPERVEDSLIAETQRLRAAHKAMQGGEAEKALELLADQAAEAEGQKLREERAAARVLALCKLGRFDEANVEATSFLQKNPRSPLAERVRNACPTSR